MSEPSPPPVPRIGDRERHRALDVLSTAFAEGRLTAEEFEERSTAALAARTEADLAVLTGDLPEPAVTAVGSGPGAARAAERLVAVMSGADRRGRWFAPAQVTAVAVMGGVHIDFRHAEVAGPTVHLTAVTIMGGIDVIVPEDWSVTMTGLAFMGGRDVRGEASSRPVVQLEVSGWALMGGVSVQHRPRRTELS